MSPSGTRKALPWLLGLLLGLPLSAPQALASDTCKDARYTYLEYEELGPTFVNLSESLEGFALCFEGNGPHQALRNEAPYRLDYAKALYAKRDYPGALSQAAILIKDLSPDSTGSSATLLQAHLIASQSLTQTKGVNAPMAEDEARAHAEAALALSDAMPTSSPLPMRAQAWSHRLNTLNAQDQSAAYSALGTLVESALTATEAGPSLRSPSDLPGLLRGLLWMSGDDDQRSRCNALLPSGQQSTPELACQRLGLHLLDSTDAPEAYDPAMERYIHRSLYRVALDRGDIDAKTYTSALSFWKDTLDTALRAQGASTNQPLISDRVRAATYLARPLLLDDGPRGQEARALFEVESPLEAARLVQGWLERGVPPQGSDALATSRLVTLALSYTITAQGTSGANSPASARAQAYLDQLPNYGDPFFRAHYDKGSTTLDPSEVALMQWSRVQLAQLTAPEVAAVGAQTSLETLVSGSDGPYLANRLWFPALAMAIGPGHQQ